MFSFSASARKLFHSAIILPGSVGVSSVTAASGSVREVAVGPENMSPSWTVIVASSSVPKPTVP